jgi:sugar phosphate permease
VKDYIVNTMLVALAVLAPIKPLLLACGVLIFADMVTGMMAARKRGEKISSASMRRTVSKLVIYHVAIISGFVLEAFMLENLLPVSKIVGGVIGLVEFKSVLENASTVAGRDLVQLVKEKLGSKNDLLKGL